MTRTLVIGLFSFAVLAFSSLAGACECQMDESQCAMALSNNGPWPKCGNCRAYCQQMREDAINALPAAPAQRCGPPTWEECEAGQVNKCGRNWSARCRAFNCNTATEQDCQSFTQDHYCYKHCQNRPSVPAATQQFDETQPSVQFEQKQNGGDEDDD